LADAGLPAPTLTELCDSLGLKSRGSLHKHVQALVRAGLVNPMEGLHRGVQLRVHQLPTDTRRIPLLGKIAAGRPMEALPETEFFDVPAALTSQRQCYALRVSGDSMVEAGILDGDWVVVESRSHARDGEIVVALVHDDEVTLKRIRQNPNRVTLIPANSTMESMDYQIDTVQIQGVVVGLMRSYL
jgi:repressor LexA